MVSKDWNIYNIVAFLCFAATIKAEFAFYMLFDVRDRLISRFLQMRNMVDYPLRQLFRWRRRGFRLKRQANRDLFAALPVEDRAQAEVLMEDLKNRYHLESFFQDSSPLNYRENLYYLSMLEKALESSQCALPEKAAAADIGASHWFYVQALHAVLKWWQFPAGRSVGLRGYEKDPYRVYKDFYSRADHAYAHMRGLPGVEYIPRGFLTQTGQLDLVTMLFPFVFERDHLEWGLPSSSFRPVSLLVSAWQSLKPGGIMIIVNQGAEEHAAQRKRLEASGIPLRAAFRMDSLLFRYPLDRFVLVCRRDHAI